MAFKLPVSEISEIDDHKSVCHTGRIDGYSGLFIAVHKGDIMKLVDYLLSSIVWETRRSSQGLVADPPWWNCNPSLLDPKLYIAVTFEPIIRLQDYLEFRLSFYHSTFCPKLRS